MTPDWAQLQESLREAFPTSRLSPMPSGELLELRQRYPHLPDHYIEFLKNIGWGSIGESSFMFYEGPVEPAEIYDARTASELAGILFIGDNFGGWCLGLERNGKLVSFDGLSPAPEEEREQTVHGFLAGWIQRVSVDVRLPK